ncbi:MAG: hybrid sensor histidine kinase/response regulator [Opitutales bacterium]|nr:hybrid sensor histidine kinase/response regulator [Opitutales bacterium]
MDGSQTHILSLKDRRADSLSLVDLLSEIPNASFTVSRAKTTAEALRCVEEGSDPVDLIFCDFQLEGETGLDLLTALKDHPRAVPVIMLTSNQDRSVDLACMEAGARDFLRERDMTPEMLDRIIRYTLANQVAERALMESLKVRDQILSIISHDIAGPLATLRSALKLLQNRLEKGDLAKTQTLLEKTEVSAGNLLELTQTLLSWAKTQTSHYVFNPSPVSLAEVVAEELRFAQAPIESKSIRVVNDVGPRHSVLADRDSVAVLVRNLLSNAIKFSFPGSVVSLCSERESNSVSLSVKDEGVGMSEELRLKLFNQEKKVSRPGTLQERGNGIGLMLCKALVERNGGYISVISDPDKGSLFRLFLPAADQ